VCTLSKRVICINREPVRRKERRKERKEKEETDLERSGGRTESRESTRLRRANEKDEKGRGEKEGWGERKMLSEEADK
jgi:hypothetical protein